jgi:4-amino-4-deoxy-L-arabinose transferase-like glycosyltransferase
MAIFPPFDSYNIRLFDRDIPLMLMSYLGTLKSWIYTALFHFATPSVWTLRLPMLLAGTATIAVFAILLRRIHGGHAAALGAALLATDASFLLSVCCDWGPTAIQILLTTLALLLLVYRKVFLAFLCIGLAVWNKALMLWTLGGLAVAAVVLFPRELKLRRLPAAVLGIGLGALPFIVYNVHSGFLTFQENKNFDFSDLPSKARLLRLTLEGSALFGYLVHEDHETVNPLPPRNALDRVTFTISELAGRPRAGWMTYAVAASILLLPVVWRSPARKPVLFGAIVFGVGWLQMAVTKNAGGSVHHTALLWPLPHLIVAVTGGELARRWRWAAVPVLLVVLSNVLVVNQYYVQVRRNGGAGNWNESNQVLAERLQELRPAKAYMVDWGVYDTLRMLSRGSLKLDWALDYADDRLVRSWLEWPGAVFVAHSDGSETLVGRREQLLAAADRLGFARELVFEIHDRNQRRRFEVYRFSAPQKSRTPAPTPVRHPAAGQSG